MGLFLILAPMIVASAIITAVALRVRRYYEGELPGWVAVTEYVAVTAVGSVTLVPAALTSGGGAAVIAVICYGVAIYSPPLMIIGVDLAAYVGAAISKALYDSSLVTPAPSSYGRARARVMENDIGGAIREYRAYFNENPKVPAPLFALARLCEQEKHFDSAAYAYREIMDRFHKNKIIWAEAGLRLADLYAQYMNDRDAAVPVLRDIIHHARYLEQSRLAANRISDSLRSRDEGYRHVL